MAHGRELVTYSTATANSSTASFGTRPRSSPALPPNIELLRAHSADELKTVRWVELPATPEQKPIYYGSLPSASPRTNTNAAPNPQAYPSPTTHEGHTRWQKWQEIFNRYFYAPEYEDDSLLYGDMRPRRHHYRLLGSIPALGIFAAAIALVALLGVLNLMLKKHSRQDNLPLCLPSTALLTAERGLVPLAISRQFSLQGWVEAALACAPESLQTICCVPGNRLTIQILSDIPVTIKKAITEVAGIALHVAKNNLTLAAIDGKFTETQLNKVLNQTTISLHPLPRSITKTNGAVVIQTNDAKVIQLVEISNNTTVATASTTTPFRLRQATSAKNNSPGIAPTS